MRRWVAVVGLLTGVVMAAPVRTQEADLRGAWQVDCYVLADGSRYQVDGLMLFSETDWAVVYFVKDADGQPQRGAGEGGPYTLDGERLVLLRDYLVIASEEIGALPEIPLRFDVPGVTDQVVEECRLEIGAGRLTIEFPSGNRMGFRRSSGP